jgi:hypothetical protein
MQLISTEVTCRVCMTWPPSAAAAGGAEPEAVGKYAAKYSASVDPFAAWRAKAAEERRASMGVHDRRGPPCSEAWRTGPDI